MLQIGLLCPHGKRVDSLTKQNDAMRRLLVVLLARGRLIAKVFCSAFIVAAAIALPGSPALAEESGMAQDSLASISENDAVKLSTGSDDEASARASGDVAGAVSAIAKAFEARADVVDLDRYGLTVDEAVEAVDEAVDKFPALAFDKASGSYWYYRHTGLVTKYEIAFLFDDDEYPAAKSRLEQRVADALSWTSLAYTEWDRLKAAHDWLVRNVHYDSENYYAGTTTQISGTAYGAIVDGVAVCQGYTRAYDLLLDRLGIESVCVGSNEMNHIWNQVEVYGHAANVDVTWDDPISSETGEDGGYWGAPSARYFYISDATFRSELGHYGYSSKLKCDDSRYEGFNWISYEGPLPPNYRFADVSPVDWFVTNGALHWSMENVVMTGYTEQSFGPYDPMTRAQFIKILWATFDPEDADYYKHGVASDTTGLPDAADCQWWTASVNWAYENGIVKGEIRPDDLVTREEAFALLSRCIGTAGESQLVTTSNATAKFESFEDSGQVSDWARREIVRLVGAGIVNGSDGRLNPKENLARCEGLQILASASSLGFAG